MPPSRAKRPGNSCGVPPMHVARQPVRCSSRSYRRDGTCLQLHTTGVRRRFRSRRLLRRLRPRQLSLRQIRLHRHHHLFPRRRARRHVLRLQRQNGPQHGPSRRNQRGTGHVRLPGSTSDGAAARGSQDAFNLAGRRTPVAALLDRVLFDQVKFFRYGANFLRRWGPATPVHHTQA